MTSGITVIGAGAWGTALAHSLAVAGKPVTLWARSSAVVAEIAASRTHTSRLPGIALSGRLHPTADIESAVANPILLLATPAQEARAVSQRLRSSIAHRHVVVNCAKGLEQSTGRLLGDVLADELPGTRIATLSGPGFANDIARGLPAALTLGCKDEALGIELAEMLSHPGLRLYWTSDTRGVELGGSVKNVLAIAAGILDGRSLGGSALAALVTRGFAEMRRLADAVGARPETLQGLSGLGDLILTCSNQQSRNFSLGRALGEGLPLEEILSQRSAVTEGVYTAAAVVQLARKLEIEMPISQAVHSILLGRLSVDAAIAALLNRPIKAED